MNKKYDLSGELILSEDIIDECVYFIGETNITEILKEIINSKTHVCHIKIYINCRLIFNEAGYLEKFKDKAGIESYYVDRENLEDVLFEHTGDFINMKINTGVKS